MIQTLELIQQIGIIPVIKLEETAKALPLAKALINGGIPVAEVTFRAAGADQVIRQIRQAYPEMAVGAGTVLTVEQAELAISAGALFVVAPALNPDVAAVCQKNNIPFIPGCVTPCELEAAMNLGLEVVKFFPAQQHGGLDGIKALCGPYQGVRFIPTGGVNLQNVSEYLSHPRVFACGGTFMVSSDLIAQDDWEGISALCHKAVEAAFGFQLDHVGINPAQGDHSEDLAGCFGSLFHKPITEGRSSYMLKGLVEVMKQPYLGAHGHLAISVNSIERACAYLRAQGVEFDPNTEKRDEKGGLKAVYLKDSLGGFAIHLMRK